jgi:hypothetical protein
VSIETSESDSARTASDGEAAQAASSQLVLSDSHVQASYANFCRVTGTPEEVVIDLGLNMNPTAKPTEPLSVSQRVVMNYFTAKRMWQALGLTLQRHEAVFGVLETNVQRRVVGQPRKPS